MFRVVILMCLIGVLWAICPESAQLLDHIDKGHIIPAAKPIMAHYNKCYHQVEEVVRVILGLLHALALQLLIHGVVYNDEVMVVLMLGLIIIIGVVYWVKIMGSRKKIIKRCLFNAHGAVANKTYLGIIRWGPLEYRGFFKGPRPCGYGVLLIEGDMMYKGQWGNAGPVICNKQN